MLTALLEGKPAPARSPIAASSSSPAIVFVDDDYVCRALKFAAYAATRG